MVKEILFYLVIWAANVIQGITGFAGTVLAMPPALLLVGYETAKPILNLLGLLAGIYVLAGNRKDVEWKEVKKMIAWMLPGILFGLLLRDWVAENTRSLTVLLGIFVSIVAVTGLYHCKYPAKEKRDRKQTISERLRDSILLITAGIVHGIFVCGGPLLISYLTKKIQEKEKFRVTISSVWIVLNGVLLIGDIQKGYWNEALIKKQIFVLPFFIGGMYCGGKLCKKMSQKTFLYLTYLLLLISAITLLVK